MASGIAITSVEGQLYNARITWLLVFSGAIASTGGLIFGYDIGTSGTFSPALLPTKCLDITRVSFGLVPYSIEAGLLDRLGSLNMQD